MLREGRNIFEKQATNCTKEGEFLLQRLKIEEVNHKVERGNLAGQLVRISEDRSKVK
jgi:hypothetical protein